MAKAIDFEKAWRQAYKKTDYSLIEPLLQKNIYPLIIEWE